MIELVSYSVLVMLASLVGVISVWGRAGKIIGRNLSLLVSFSAGVFTLIAYHLSEEALEHASTVSQGLIWIIVGAFAIWIIFKLLPSFHHHHDEELESNPHSQLDARRIMTSDALHNIGDGILLAASFSIGSQLGVLTALSIFIHELVQEMSEFFVLKQAGYSTRRALILNFLISGTILLGAIGGFFLLDNFETFETPLLGISSGAFLVVVIHDLIPHSVRASKQKRLYLKHLLFFILGTTLMYLINNIAL